MRLVVVLALALALLGSGAAGAETVEAIAPTEALAPGWGNGKVGDPAVAGPACLPASHGFGRTGWRR